MNKKVGICITTFNNKDIIQENLISAIYQDCTSELGVYVVDDGSTDGTRDILSELAVKEDKLNILLAPHRERGLTRSDAIQMAIDDSCDYILFIDSDMKLDLDLVTNCLKSMENSDVSALIVPEEPYSKHSNFMTKVKIFERKLINNRGADIEKNSIEAARFWRTEEYLRSGGLNSGQIAFEETQPTIRIIEKGGVVKRVMKSKLYHDEGKVTFLNLIQKKGYYFGQMTKTTATEENGFFKALSRWYFFRPYMYSKNSLISFFKSPLKFAGLVSMYLALTLIAFKSYVVSSIK